MQHIGASELLLYYHCIMLLYAPSCSTIGFFCFARLCRCMTVICTVSLLRAPLVSCTRPSSNNLGSLTYCHFGSRAHDTPVSLAVTPASSNVNNVHTAPLYYSECMALNGVPSAGFKVAPQLNDLLQNALSKYSYAHYYTMRGAGMDYMIAYVDDHTASSSSSSDAVWRLDLPSYQTASKPADNTFRVLLGNYINGLWTMKGVSAVDIYFSIEPIYNMTTHDGLLVDGSLLFPLKNQSAVYNVSNVKFASLNGALGSYYVTYFVDLPSDAKYIVSVVTHGCTNRNCELLSSSVSAPRADTHLFLAAIGDMGNAGSVIAAPDLFVIQSAGIQVVPATPVAITILCTTLVLLLS